MRCPTCSSQTSPASRRLGPFCSERCQLVDLGRWLGEEYRVPEVALDGAALDVESAEDAEHGRSRSMIGDP